MRRIKRAFSHSEKGDTATRLSSGSQIPDIKRSKQVESVLSDGTRIPHYVALDVNEILPEGHPRIFKDYAKGPLTLEKQYCSLELARFLAFLQRENNRTVTPKMLETINSPVPEASTDKQISELMKQWFDIFNTWFFAGTLTKTRVLVGNYEPIDTPGFYDPASNTIIISPGSYQYDYPGTDAQFHICGLLHEMVHAFIAQASCKRDCCMKYYHPSLGGEGEKSRHGPCFLDCYLLVTDVFEKFAFWKTLDGLSDCVADSMWLDVWQPSQHQLEGWHADTHLSRNPEVWYFHEDRQKAIEEDQKRDNLADLDGNARNIGRICADCTRSFKDMVFS